MMRLKKGEKPMNTNFKVGDEIRIIWMSGKPEYCGVVGVIINIDNMGQLSGTWGDAVVIPQDDVIEVIKIAE